MVKRAAWSAAEDDAFLRAWADVEPQWSQQSGRLHKALLARFAELWDANTTRTEGTIGHRRIAHIRTHDIIHRFHAHSRTQQTQSSGDAYSSDDYFELHRDEQRRWIATLRPRCHYILMTTRATFDRVHAILAQTRRSTSALERQTKRKRRSTSARAHAPLRAIDSLTEESRADSSSTESDDDLLQLQWMAHSDSEDDVPLVHLMPTPVHIPLSSDTMASDLDQLHALESANGDLLGLIDVLRGQATRFHTMVTQAEHEHVRDVRERQCAAKKMRSSHDRVLEHVQRCERLLEQGRDENERARERAAIERELTYWQRLAR